MAQLSSSLNTRSEEFAHNVSAMQKQIDDLRDKVAHISLGGNEKARSRHLQRNKLLARDRVKTLLDVGSPFLELSQFAAYACYDDEEVPAAGLITGIGLIHGQPCMVVANDATVKGGTYYPLAV